jgi:hypothetical protein
MRRVEAEAFAVARDRRAHIADGQGGDRAVKASGGAAAVLGHAGQPAELGDTTLALSIVGSSG